MERKITLEDLVIEHICSIMSNTDIHIYNKLRINECITKRFSDPKCLQFIYEEYLLAIIFYTQSTYLSKEQREFMKIAVKTVDWKYVAENL